MVIINLFQSMYTIADLSINYTSEMNDTSSAAYQAAWEHVNDRIQIGIKRIFWFIFSVIFKFISSFHILKINLTGLSLLTILTGFLTHIIKSLIEN